MIEMFKMAKHKYDGTPTFPHLHHGQSLRLSGTTWTCSLFLVSEAQSVRIAWPETLAVFLFRSICFSHDVIPQYGRGTGTYFWNERHAPGTIHSCAR